MMPPATEPDVANPARPAPPRPGRGVGWLAAALVAILLTAFAASVAARQDWLDRGIAELRLAATSAPTEARDTVLRAAGFATIDEAGPNGARRLLAPPAGDLPGDGPPAETIVTDGESWTATLASTAAALVARRDALVAVTVPGGTAGNPPETATLHRASLTEAVRRAAGRTSLAALLVAIVVGLFRPAALATISQARGQARPKTPGRPPASTPTSAVTTSAPAGPVPPANPAALGDGRLAAWQTARVAAVVTLWSKLSHDVRGALSPALLTAERLQGNADPSVARCGDVLVRSVERAIELLTQASASTREGAFEQAPGARGRWPLAAIVAEAARQAAPDLDVNLDSAEPLDVEVDRADIMAVFVELLGNASRAGAHLVRVQASANAGELVIILIDDAGGLPEAVREHPFRPARAIPPGNGRYGLATARNRARAHRGDLLLDSTGPDGSTFRLTVPGAPARRPTAPQS